MQPRGDVEEQLVFIRAAKKLDAYGQAFARDCHGDGDAGETENIGEDGRHQRLEKADLTAVDFPFALAVAEGGDAAYGHDDDGEAFHLAQQRGAHAIARGQVGEHLFGGHFLAIERFGGGPVGFGLTAFDELAGGGRGPLVEEEGPDVGGALEAARFKGLDGVAERFQQRGGAANGGSDFGIDRDVVKLFPEPDGGIGGGEVAQRDGSGKRIGGIEGGECAEEQPKVGGVARHRAGDGVEAERIAEGREVAGGGDAAGSGLEAGDAAKMRGHANGAAAIAADAAGRAEGGDGGGFTAGGTAGSARRVGGMAGAAGDEVVGFVAGEQLGCVGLAEEDGAMATELRDGGGIGGGAMADAQAAADLGGQARNVEAVFDGDWHAVQRAQGLTARDGGFAGASFFESALGEYHGECVDRRIAALDLAQMGFDEFHRRKRTGANARSHFDERKPVWHEHSVTTRHNGFMAPLTFAEARGRVLEEVRGARKAPATEEAGLDRAAGRVLAEDVAADRDSPAVARSVRDGYAVRAADLPGELRIIGEVRAGERFTGTVGAGQAVEIMTGAPMPAGADAVVMVEHTRRVNGRAQIDRPAEPGQFINPRGCEAAAGEVVLERGKRLDYSDVAMLAAFGRSRVLVYARPRVAIVATGDEIVEVDEKPEEFQIRNSNARSLAAQVERAGGEPQVLPVARDTVEHTREIVARGLAADLLLLSGGVSAGKYDVVEEVLAGLGAEFFFDRVLIQPGQPLVFGRVMQTFFFGLPGNPSSTMVTFEVFARAALELLAGQEEIALHMPLARLTREFRHRAGLTRFLPARLSADGSEVTPVEWHGSGDVPALTRANAYLVADAGRPEYSSGELIRVLMK